MTRTFALLISTILVSTLADCGSGPSKTATPVVHTDPIPMTEPSREPTSPPTEPARAPEAHAPSEPATSDAAKVKAELLAAEMNAYEKAKPVFEANCARCHTKAGKVSTEKKRSHFDMTTYPFGGHHAMAIAAQIRKSLGMTGDKPTMPYDKKGSVKGNELALIGAWADAFDAAHAAGAHDGHGDHEHGDHDHGGHDHHGNHGHDGQGH